MAALRRVSPAVLRRVFLTRRHSSAAAVALDYYDDDRYYEPELKLGFARWEPRRGVQWAIIGEPRGKKHVYYAMKLAKLLEVPRISIGSLVRQELHPRSSLYKQIARAVNEGRDVPEEIIFPLLSKRLEEGYYRGETGFILDGIPRTRFQAEVLDQIAEIDLVVNFKCPTEHLVKKNLSTGNLSILGLENHGRYPSLQSADKLPGTSDSAARNTWEEKMRVYVEQIKSLEDYYRRQNKLLDFQEASAPADTWRGLLQALHLQHMNAVHSSKNLSPRL